jgi:hypothetical protein
VKVQDTSDVTSSAYQEQDRLNSDFDDVAGVFSPELVQTNRQLNETVGGMQLLNVNTNQVGAYQLRTFTETWAEPVLRQVAAARGVLRDRRGAAGHVRAAGRPARGVRRRPHHARAAAQEVTLRIDIGFGATNPIEQVNNFMLAMRSLKELLADGVLEKYGIDIHEIVKELFGKLGYRDGKRFFDPNVDPALKAAQATIDELQQKMSQKMSPELESAQIRKIGRRNPGSHRQVPRPHGQRHGEGAARVLRRAPDRPDDRRRA